MKNTKRNVAIKRVIERLYSALATIDSYSIINLTPAELGELSKADHDKYKELRNKQKELNYEIEILKELIGAE